MSVVFKYPYNGLFSSESFWKQPQKHDSLHFVVKCYSRLLRLHNEHQSYSSYEIALRSHFYQTRSAWFMDQGSIRNHSAFHDLVPTVTKFCVMWEGLSLPHDTKFGNSRGKNCWQENDFHLILDPWMKLIRFDKSGARWMQQDHIDD